MDLDALFAVTGTEGIDTPVLSCNRCGARVDAVSAIVQLGES